MLSLLATLVAAPLLATAVPHETLVERQLNIPALNALQVCAAIAANVSSASHVYYPLNLPQYAELSEHYASSSSATSACVFEPGSNQDLGNALVLLGANKTPFAVESGGHASNPGFSSTTGVHISMRGFNQNIVSADKSYVDVGPGQTWDATYAVVQAQGKLVNGGRVGGVGVGGFLTGGGGYTWFTNQVGLSVDTMTEATIVLTDGSTVTASPTQNSDLFFGIKGAGNRLGVLTNARLKTLPYQGAIYGGFRVYGPDQVQAINNATAAFQAQNKDPKAQVITTYEGIPILNGVVLLLLFYDAPQLPSPSPFAGFDAIPAIIKTDKSQSYTSYLQSVPSNVTTSFRTYFQTVSLQTINSAVLQEVTKQMDSLGNQVSNLLNSGVFLSWDVEPFLLSTMYQQSPPSAFPHLPNQPFVPLNIYFGWELATQDQYFLTAIEQAAQQIAAAATASGQNLNGLPLYPNYALYTATGEQLFQQNLDTLRQIRSKYDPKGIMEQCGGFNW